MDWSEMPTWYTSTNLQHNKTTVQINKQTQRRSIAEKAFDTGVRLQFRKPTRSLSTIGHKAEKHPMYYHVPGISMSKSTSAHGEINVNKSITNHLDYHPSHRLQMHRTTDVLHFKKMGSRRPLVRSLLSFFFCMPYSPLLSLSSPIFFSL